MTNQTVPAAKPDNLFGVCHEVGEIFGFDPLYLRLLFMAAMLVNFEAAAIAYAVLALLVLGSATMVRLTRPRTPALA